MTTRLLIFTENYARGGGNRYMVDLANSVAADFGEVEFASNPGGIYAEDLARLSRSARTRNVSFVTRAGISRRTANWPRWLQPLLRTALTVIEPLLMLLNVILLVALVKQVRPSLILVCNGGYPAAQACLAMVLAGHLCKVDTTLSIASMPAPRRSHMRLYERMLDRLVWKSCKLVVVNARAIVEALVSMRELPASKVAIVRNGIEDLPAQQAAGAPQDGDELVIGCVARMDVMKGALLLIEAFIELAPEHQRLRLVLAGEGDASARIAQRVKEAGLAPRVSLLGHFSGDVDKLLKTFDVFAFPSLWEGFPYSVVEAMRAGCAIIATDVGGIPEAIENGRDGMLVTAGSKDALVAGIRTMISDEQFRNRVASNARKRFMTEFSLPEMHRRARAILMAAQ